MGQIRKLTEAGESLTMKVVEAEQVAGNFGQQAKFVGENGDTLYLPLDSATRQLDRIPLTIEGCVGELLTFSRDPNPKPGAKPFWGIRVAGAAERAPAPSKRLSYSEAAKPTSSQQVNPPLSGATTAQEKARVARAYLDLFGYVKSQPEMQGVSDVAVQAAAATIWIAWNQQGLTRAESPKAEAPKPAPKKAEPDFSKFPESADEDLPF